MRNHTSCDLLACMMPSHAVSISMPRRTCAQGRNVQNNHHVRPITNTHIQACKHERTACTQRTRRFTRFPVSRSADTYPYSADRFLSSAITKLPSMKSVCDHPHISTEPCNCDTTGKWLWIRFNKTKVHETGMYQLETKQPNCQSQNRSVGIVSA
jgi:hypothetical protein